MTPRNFVIPLEYDTFWQSIEKPFYATDYNGWKASRIKVAAGIPPTWQPVGSASDRPRGGPEKILTTDLRVIDRQVGSA